MRFHLSFEKLQSTSIRAYFLFDFFSSLLSSFDAIVVIFAASGRIEIAIEAQMRERERGEKIENTFGITLIKITSGYSTRTSSTASIHPIRIHLICVI